MIENERLQETIDEYKENLIQERLRLKRHNYSEPLRNTIEENNRDIELAIKWLEELQQYRAIGTIDKLETYKNGDCMNECKHYDNCANYIYSKGYNKAIDDYKKLLIENNVIPEWREVIEELAEEVRENGDNRKLLHETGNGQ